MKGNIYWKRFRYLCAAIIAIINLENLRWHKLKPYVYLMRYVQNKTRKIKTTIRKLELIKWMDEKSNEKMTAILIDNSEKLPHIWNKHTIWTAINRLIVRTGTYNVNGFSCRFLRWIFLCCNKWYLKSHTQNAILIKYLNQVLFAVWFFSYIRWLLFLFRSNEIKTCLNWDRKVQNQQIANGKEAKLSRRRKKNSRLWARCQHQIELI